MVTVIVFCFIADRIFSIIGLSSEPASFCSKSLTVSRVFPLRVHLPMSSTRPIARAIPSPLPKKGPLAWRAFTVNSTVPQDFWPDSQRYISLLPAIMGKPPPSLITSLPENNCCPVTVRPSTVISWFKNHCRPYSLPLSSSEVARKKTSRQRGTPLSFRLRNASSSMTVSCFVSTAPLP